MSKTNNSYLTKAFKEASKKKGDLTKAFILLEKAYRLGNPKAAYALGTWYLHGKHVEKNIKKALSLLREASRHNVPEALFDLAVCYETGMGVSKNDRLAMESYLRAALYGDKQAIYEVGRCYYYGIGTQQAKRIARIWVDRAKSLEGKRGKEYRLKQKN